MLNYGLIRFYPGVKSCLGGRCSRDHLGLWLYLTQKEKTCKWLGQCCKTYCTTFRIETQMSYQQNVTSKVINFWW